MSNKNIGKAQVSKLAVWPRSHQPGHITLRRARLVLRWVIVRRYTIFIYNEPLRPTQPPTLSTWKQWQSSAARMITVGLTWYLMNGLS